MSARQWKSGWTDPLSDDQEGILRAVDEGIRAPLRILFVGGFETYESCQGGEGHAYTEPTIAFYGGRSEGFRAVDWLLVHGIKMMELRRMWDIIDGEPTGPNWQITFPIPTSPPIPAPAAAVAENMPHPQQCPWCSAIHHGIHHCDKHPLSAPTPEPAPAATGDARTKIKITVPDELVRRLREYWPSDEAESFQDLITDAADRIEADAARILELHSELDLTHEQLERAESHLAQAAKVIEAAKALRRAINTAGITCDGGRAMHTFDTTIAEFARSDAKTGGE